MGSLLEEADANKSDRIMQLSPAGSGLAIMPAKSTPDASVLNTTSFSDLSDDVLFIIAEHCDRRGLLRFCRLSKATMEASIPHIYRDVNLSTHHRGLVLCRRYDPRTGFFLGGTQEEHSDSVRCIDRPVTMIPRQQRFVKTMKKRTEYRKYVQVVTWTFLPSRDNRRGHSTDVGKNAFWSTMRFLDNIRGFDLADLSERWGIEFPRSSVCPGQYFANCSSLSLLGVMESPLPASILSTVDPAKLVSLTLDNVQCCGKTPFGTVFGPPPMVYAELQRYLVRWLCDDPRFVWPGPRLGLTKPLIGRCTGLKSLTLRKVGDRNSRESEMIRSFYDMQVLIEWSSFVESVCRTLEEFRFEHGPRQEPQINPNLRVHPVRSMDKHFGIHLFPALLAGPWPCLKMMEIRGVRS